MKSHKVGEDIEDESMCAEKHLLLGVGSQSQDLQPANWRPRKVDGVALVLNQQA